MKGVAKWAGYGKAIERAEEASKAEEQATRTNAAAKAALAKRMQIAASQTVTTQAKQKTCYR